MHCFSVGSSLLWLASVSPIESAETPPNAANEKAAGGKDAKAKAKGKPPGKDKDKDKDKDSTPAKGKTAKGEGGERHDS